MNFCIDNEIQDIRRRKYFQHTPAQEASKNAPAFSGIYLLLMSPSGTIKYYKLPLTNNA